MPNSQIQVTHLVKTYQVPVREAGLRSAVRSSHLIDRYLKPIVRL